MKKGKMQTWVLVLAMSLIIGASLSVSVPREVNACFPNSITAIDMKTGIVTAKNLTTEESFEFKVGDAAQLRSIKIGDKVSTDIKTGAVIVHGVQTVNGTLLKAPMHPAPLK